MLKDFGVQGVKVQEIISLDEDMLATLPYDHEAYKCDHFPQLSDHRLANLYMD